MEDLREMMPDQDFNFDNDESFEFHYFKLHDYDNNNRLDGLELGKQFNKCLITSLI